MFPLSHTYVTKNVTGKSNPLLIFGSILPDIATTSKQQIARAEIHDAPKKFQKFIESNYSSLFELGLGVRLHSQIDGGADFYSDDAKTGYAMLNGEKLSESVARLLEMEQGVVSHTIAHNFIEMAVDHHIKMTYPEIAKIYSEAMTGANQYFDLISECMGEYLKLDKGLIKEELSYFASCLSPNSLVSAEAMVDKIAIPLIKLRLDKNVDRQLAISILHRAIEMTQDTYKEFLDRAVTGVRANIA